MNVTINDNMLGLDEASARLAELEKSEPAEQQQPPVNQEQRATADPAGGDRAAAPENKDVQDPNAKKTDTPAAPDPKNPEAGKSQDNPPEQKPGEKPKSNFAKSQERLEKTWEGVNKRKGELDTRQQTLEQKERDLAQREETFRRSTEESQAQNKPEDFDKAANLKFERAKALNERADGIEARAQKLEDEGDHRGAAKLADEARQLRKQANKEEGNAEDLKAHAEGLRKNPPASFVEREKKLEGQRKEWTIKAAQDFPEMAKDGTALNTAVKQHLNALWQQDRVLASHPQIIYHVTRLAAAETAAARVPGLEKQLGELTAKVKDYEKLTSPGGAGAAQRVDTATQAKTDDEERNELKDMAGQMGAFR